MSAADNKIDELYQQPLADFTGARNALAKTLSGADAQRVKALPKPTVVAWAANQLYWRARALYDALMKSGERVRKAQIAALQGKAADIRAANDDHRRAVAAAVAEAERLASSAGSKPAPEALTRTFEAISLTPHPPDPPGRLAESLQPGTGFEALAGITPVGGGKGVHPDHGPAKAPHRDTRATEHHDPGSDREPEKSERKPTARERDAARRAEKEAREAARRAEDEARKRDAELRKADALVARAEATEKLARASWEHAHDALLEARRRRDEIKRSLT